MLLALCAFLAAHNVGTSVTETDRVYIHKILTESGFDPLTLKNDSRFEAQIETVLAVQASAFHTAPDKGVLPLDGPREPADLYASTSAYCGDRSRYMYKALKDLGFRVRFASIFVDLPGKSVLATLLTPGMEGAQSHAVVEVETEKGWLVVDSRNRWISLDDSNAPRSLRNLQAMASEGSFPEWSRRNRDDIYFLMKEPYHVFYGLYSRHGRFYAPYTPYVPDADWAEFTANLWR